MQKKSEKHKEFEFNREDYTERDIQMELLYSNWLIQKATEKTRANTSKTSRNILSILRIIVIGIILSIILAILLP